MNIYFYATFSNQDVFLASVKKKFKSHNISFSSLSIFTRRIYNVHCTYGTPDLQFTRYDN